MSAAAGMLDLLLPEACLGCAANLVSGQGLCQPCHVKLLSLVATGYCPRCGSSLGPNVPPNDAGCKSCPDPLPRFSRVVRLGPYADPLKSMLR